MTRAFATERRIVLVRHGRADRLPAAPLSRDEVLAWLRAYDDCSLLEGEVPPPSVRALADRAGIVVCSGLPRAVESARLLAAADVEPVVSPLLAETPMPVPRIGERRVSLRTWSLLVGLGALGRTLARAPAPAEITAQAEAAARWLDGLSALHGSVLAVTHVNVRAHIARALGRQGWTRTGRAPRYANWGAWTLTRTGASPR